MKRITTLGAILAAVLALGAIAAGSASATSAFVAESTAGGTVTLNGSPTEPIEIYTVGPEVECNGPQLQGTGTTTMFSMPFGSMSNPKCLGGGTPELKSNGCGLTFHPGTEIAKGTFQGTFDIGPAGCGPITFHTSWGCTTEIGAQTGMPATFVNTGSGSSGGVSVSIDEATFTYSRSGGCSPGPFKGTLSAGWQVSAKDSGGSQVGVHALGDLANGLQLDSFGSQFEAERYPAGLGGTETGEFLFETEFGEAECSGATLSGGQLPSASPEIKVTPSFPAGKKCWVLGFPATPSVNGCQYAFYVNKGNGVAALDCPAGKSLEIKSTYCNVSIPEQTLGTATFKNTGTGTGRKLQATFSGSALEYSASGGFCGKGTTAENGTLYPDTVLIQAFNPYS